MSSKGNPPAFQNDAKAAGNERDKTKDPPAQPLTKAKRKGSRQQLTTLDQPSAEPDISSTSNPVPTRNSGKPPRPDQASASLSEGSEMGKPPRSQPSPNVERRKSGTNPPSPSTDVRAVHTGESQAPSPAKGPSQAQIPDNAAAGEAPPMEKGKSLIGNMDGPPSIYNFKELPPDCTPLLAFVNSRSGDHQGTHLIGQLRRLLNPIQVIDLASEDPKAALNNFKALERLRLLVCGGDGTAKWIMGVLEDISPQQCPPMAILPLGTGNDLARVLGWGGGYTNESMVEHLAQVQRSHMVIVDRWQLEIKSLPKRSKQSTKHITFNNYFGIGVDAQAALKFHHLREQKPHYFFNRLVNKLWYGALGAQDLFRRTCVNLPERVKLTIDGSNKEIELPATVQGLIFLNIESYGGGVRLWSNEDDKEDSPGTGWSEGGDSFHNASMQDGMLEVVAINGVVHLGQLQMGLSKAVKICQCREATVSIHKDLPVQADGEPWGQSKGTIKITRKPEPAYMLKRTLDTGGAVATEMAELMDWAVTREIIGKKAKKELLTEFSRRVEVRRKVYEQEVQQNELSILGSKAFEPLTRFREESQPADCTVA